jgi:mutator protein MutT
MTQQNKRKLIVRVIIKHGDNVLLVRRSKTNSRAGCYEFPGGNVDEGENFEIAAQREALEETGIELDVLHFKETQSYEYGGDMILSGIFEAKATTDSVTLSEEHDDYRWVNANNYHNVELESHYAEYLQKYFSTDKIQTELITETPKNTTISHLVAYTDGGSRGNPGPSASGYVLMNEDEEVLEEGGEYLGITTNNQAEYQAVKLALENAKKYQPKEISFFIDSLLVVNQMNGVFKIKSKELWPIHEAIKQLAKQYQKVTFTHVRREFNTLADEQVNIVLDSYEHRSKSRGVSQNPNSN